MKNCTQEKHVLIPWPCAGCGRAVCRNCSYIVDGKQYCTTCHGALAQKWYDEDGICPNCGSECAPIYENNGFPEGIGPTMIEIAGWQPCENCKYSEEL